MWPPPATLATRRDVMEQTGAFFLYLLLATFVAGTVIVLLRTRDSAERLAQGFRWLAALLALAGLLGVAAISLAPQHPIAGVVRPALRIVGQLGWLVVGTAIASALLAGSRRGAASAFAGSPALVTGLALYVALAFFGFEIGKAAHDGEMRQFFTASGYPVWFMYAVMAAEIAGASALLAARTRLVAACWLGMVMIGAIATHARNGDPFSDSLDAVRMLLLVACIAVHDARHRPGRAAPITASPA